MTEQEQVEKWRVEFELWGKNPPRNFNLEVYCDNSSWPGQYRAYNVQCAWEAWCEAKRAQKPVELPKRELDDCKMLGEFRNGMEEGYRICHRIITGGLESAGTPYSVKGE